MATTLDQQNFPRETDPPSTITFDAEDFASYAHRYRAVCIDLLFIIVLVGSVLMTIPDFENARVVRKALIFSIFFYEPVFTSLGATLGQRIMGLRVRKFSTPWQNISLSQALFRMIVKYCLGWISILSALFSKTERTLHDLASGSIVLKKTSKKLEKSSSSSQVGF